MQLMLGWPSDGDICANVDIYSISVEGNVFQTFQGDILYGTILYISYPNCKVMIY